MKIQSYWFILFFALILYLAFLGSYPLFDKDEPYYAEAAREMIERNSYILPYFNYQPRYEKPILFYLFEILSFSAFGVNEFAARLPSAIFAVGLLLTNYFFCKRYDSEFNSKWPLFCSLILATSLEFFVLARMSITDMVLNFFISTALLCFFIFYEKNLYQKDPKKQVGFLYLAAIAIAGGILTKGPIALILPALIVFIFLLLTRNLWYFLKNYYLHIVFSLLLIAVISLPWYFAAHIQSNGEFTKVFFVEENFNRFFDQVKVHKASPWWFYFPVVLIGFMPWTLFMPKALLQFKENYVSGTIKKDILLYASIWALSFFVFYSISGVKLINYILPIYLPLALITSMELIERKKVFSTFIIILFLVYFSAAAFLFPYLNSKKQETLLNFIKSVPYTQSIYSIGFESPAAIFYTQRQIKSIKFKELERKIQGEEKLFFIIRNHEYKKLSKADKNLLIIDSQDKKNFYGHAN